MVGQKVHNLDYPTELRRAHWKVGHLALQTENSMADGSGPQLVGTTAEKKALQTVVAKAHLTAGYLVDRLDQMTADRWVGRTVPQLEYKMGLC